MSPTPPTATSLRVSALSQKAPTLIELRPNAEEIAALAREMGIVSLRKLSLTGAVQPMGTQDWQLTARLGATVVQSCVVTLEPVTTRIDVDVTRSYIRDYEDVDAPEIEMPEDDSVEPLGTWIDPAVVMAEELALALPAYPRKDGAEPVTLRVTEPGKTPMSDEQARPFAGLAALRGKLDDQSDN